MNTDWLLFAGAVCEADTVICVLVYVRIMKTATLLAHPEGVGQLYSMSNVIFNENNENKQTNKCAILTRSVYGTSEWHPQKLHGKVVS